VDKDPAERPPGGPLRLCLRWVERIARIYLVAMMLVILAFTVGQVVDRYILKSTFNAYDQLARMGLVWATFIGLALGFREHANIRIDLIDHVLPRHAVLIKQLVFDVAVLALVILINIESWRVVEVGAFQMVIGTPFTYELVYLALTCGTVLLGLFALLRIADAVTGRRFALDPAAPR